MENHSEAVISAMPEVSPLVGSISTTNLALLSLVIALFLFVVVSFGWGKSKSKGNALLLVGPSDSGKTAILSNLAYNRTLPSHTSLQTNSVQVTLSPTKTLLAVDVPGHPRIRDQFREYLKDTKAIAFVVDCSTISRNGAVVAEHLHCVLDAVASLPPTQTTPGLLILAHKADILKAGASSNLAGDVAISRVRTILERELEKRRVSQSGGVGVESLGAEGEGTELGGLECSGIGGEFRFKEWEGGNIEFVSSWVKDKEGDDGLIDLKAWLTQM